jgi:hypothetical protein
MSEKIDLCKEYYICDPVYTSPDFRPISNPIAIDNSFSSVKAVGAWSWPLTSI